MMGGSIIHLLLPHTILFGDCSSHYFTILLGGSLLVYEVEGLGFGEGYLFTVSTISFNATSIPVTISDYITVCKQFNVCSVLLFDLLSVYILVCIPILVYSKDCFQISMFF